ncbi:peptidoglycan DD-metalloendopeptidase family protein, partial [Flavobacterium sp.]|uniref:peptidoglycan DD-metalloendopeptidase family protein n=1 Tax=Flavobacterium sp. TaxID=239 RepID=UPI00286E454F
DADLPVLEGKENGAEITVLKAMVEKGVARIKIKLRPKADTDLKTWKEKLIKGKKEGTYSYKFKNPTTITDSNKKQLATIILNNAKEGKQDNPKIQTGKTAFADDIEKVLENKTYNSGATISFDTYKPQTEYLWLKAECTGTQKHEKEFLKRDGEYFEIGKKCPRCEDEITLKHIEDCFGVHSNSTTLREDVVKYLNQYINLRKGTDKPIHLNTCLRKAHFFAQVGAETLGISTDWIVETDVIPYAARNITTSLFGNRATELSRRGQIDSFASERPQTSLLNFLYAAENGFGNGNGNEASGDGFKFRGRGLKQLTGRGNYKEASETLKETFPDEYVDLEADPDKVKEAKYAVLSAIAYWEKHEIWKVADTIKESTDDNIKKIRRTVNGGTAGWKKAKEFFEKAKTVFKVNECNPGGSGDWHDPVDNPIATIFTQGQSDGVFNDPGKHWGLFGNTRGGRKHAGLDLFTKTGTSIYACVDGTVYNRRWHSGYGNTITIKVKDKDAFLKLKKDYELKDEANGEIKQGTGWSENGDIFLFYAHLDSVNEYTFGQEVVCGDVLGTTGRSGVTAGTCAPHLHFEILSDYTMGVGHNYRLNAGFFVSFKAFDDQTESEKSTQQVEAQRGQINEVDGKNKLTASNIF